jgi:acetyl esterase/lipase
LNIATSAKMPFTNDLVLDGSRFLPSNVREDTKKMNAVLDTLTTKGPRWHEVGVAKYRQMRETGETPLPVPVYLSAARDATLPSREVGRNIHVRVYAPENGEKSKGVFLHFHGGGFVLATEKQ